MTVNVMSVKMLLPASNAAPTKLYGESVRAEFRCRIDRRASGSKRLSTQTESCSIESGGPSFLLGFAPSTGLTPGDRPLVLPSIPGGQAIHYSEWNYQTASQILCAASSMLFPPT